MDFENHAPILILRQPKSNVPFAQAWALARRFD
jgi:hypothetical protein